MLLENTQPDISIIVPVYNVSAYLQRAVDSLLAQSFSNFELFLVDDGSTDDSGKLCDKLALADERIRVIHQENTGAAGARNTALAQAQGQFVYFMDADDWCEPEMLEAMFTFAQQNALDLVVTGFFIDTYYAEDKFYQELHTVPPCVYESQQHFRAHAHELFDAQLLYAPWNKLYRRSYLVEHNIVFPATFWDDLPFNLDVIRNIKHVGCVDGNFYHYVRARAESENTKYRPAMYDKREEEHRWLHELYAQWNMNTPETEEFLARRYAERLVGCIENITNKSCTLSEEEKREEVARMITSSNAKEALALARPQSLMMRIMLFPLQHENVRLALAEGRIISWVHRHCVWLFAHLKANR